MGPEKIFLIVVIGLCVVGAILSSVTNKKIRTTISDCTNAQN